MGKAVPDERSVVVGKRKGPRREEKMMQRFPAFGYVLCAALASCATPKPNADSSAALTTDTLKAAPVAMQAPDTTKAMSATTGATTKAKTTAKRRSSKTSS